MRFRFWGVDATPGEASPRVLRLGEGPLSLAASDAFGFTATKVLGLIGLELQPSPPPSATPDKVAGVTPAAAESELPLETRKQAMPGMTSRRDTAT
jgi:hypothetical protein